MTTPLVETPEPEFVEEILDDEPSPDSPPAPTVEPAAPAAVPAAQPSESTPAQPRDTKGRFAGQQPAVKGSPLPSEAPPPVAAVESLPAAPAPEPTPEPIRWEFNADKQPYHLEGAVRGDFGEGIKGLYIPDQHVALVEQLIAEGIAHRGSWRQREAELQAQLDRPSAQTLEKWRSADPEIIRAKAFNDKLTGMMLEAIKTGDVTPIAAWLDDFKTNFPVLMAQADKSAVEAQLQALQADRDSGEEDREATALAPKMQSTLQQVVRELAARPAYTGADAEAIYGRIVSDPVYLDAVVYEKPQSERPGGPAADEVLLGHGRNGTLYLVNWGRIEQEFAYQSRFLNRTTQTASSAATQAAQKAAAAVRPAASAPPAVAAAGSPVPPPAALPIPKGKKEVEKWISSGKWKQSFPE